MRNFSLNAKLIALVGTLVFISAATNIYSISRLAALDHEISGIVEVNVPRIRIANQLRDFARQIAIEERNLMLETDPAGMKEANATLDERKAELDSKLEQAFAIASEKGRAMYGDFRNEMLAYWRTSQEVRALVAKNDRKAALQVALEKGAPARKAAANTISEIIEFNQQVLNEDDAQARTAYQRARAIMILISVVSLLASAGALLVLIRTLNRSINRVIDTLARASSEVAKTSQQIASASEQLSQASSEQASSLQETSSSLEELTSMVGKNTENAKTAAETTQTSLNSAESGKQTIQAMVGAIQELEHSNQQIADIVRVFGEVQEKTKVIEDIVFQTQLLSFNASVEAARAGEHGKGFAVVAEEVGNLADMSGNASTEIASLLQGSLKQVESTVEAIRTKIARLVSEGQQGMQALETIVANVTTSSSKAAEIATASHEQSRGIQEINRAMTQLDQSTQQNAATSEEAASAAEELSGQATALRNTVNELILVIKGEQNAMEKS